MPSDPSLTWQPDDATVANANVTAAMHDLGIDSYAEFHDWSVEHRGSFWEDAISRLGIVLRTRPSVTLESDHDAAVARWLPGARLNITESCFQADPDATAVIHGAAAHIRRVSFGELRSRVMQAANGLRNLDIRPGDRVAIAMPMTVEAVVAYLATVWVGAMVVSIADSFAADEIAARLRMADCSTVITQDVARRGGKTLPMYEKVVASGADTVIVVETGAGLALGRDHLTWEGFEGSADFVEPVIADAGTHTNILFSSGTTGEPKAIPWTHLTPIKAAADGHYHQDIHAGDVVAWPTNLGWMMGPWLIYASLINGATIALCDDAPIGAPFARFVEEAKVSILGVVPSLVAAWRSSGAVAGHDWSRIRLFSSTGEVSNPSDMAYLMGLAGHKPVIEYCGGTEIGGGYITGTVVQPAVPALFSTPALGLDLRVLDEFDRKAASGEVFLVGPSMGMSESLLNRDHHDVYYAGTPTVDGARLRRHGDQMEELEGGYYRALGRVDDTMNLGGIKVSSAEIELVVAVVAGVTEAAAIAVPPVGGGPSLLVVFAVPEPGSLPDPELWRATMQAEIREHLNPLFKVHEVVPIETLPRTASAKVMHRSLRNSYGKS